MPSDGRLAESLQMLEEQLLQPAVRADRVALESLLAPDFREFGSSGRMFDRAAIIALLLAEAPGSRQARLSDFVCTLLGDEAALVTYRTSVDDGTGTGTGSLRSSVWVRRQAQWSMIFHQGTRTP